jgi:hypothetical protein
MAYKVKFSTRTKVTDKGDAWGRGRVEQPVYAVAGANDTGTWKDSPNNSYKVNDELKDVQKYLAEKGIKSKIVNQQSSNAFMVRRWIIVEEDKYAEGKKLADEYFKENQTKTEYLYTADTIKPEERISEYEIEPKFDSKKDFYGKANVRNEGNKKILRSYETDVAYIEDGKPVVKGLYSATTTRHIKEFLKQNGFKADTSKQIMEDYGEK